MDALEEVIAESLPIWCGGTSWKLTQDNGSSVTRTLNDHINTAIGPQ